MPLRGVLNQFFYKACRMNMYGKFSVNVHLEIVFSEEIWREEAEKRLKGNPFAANTLGRLLDMKLDEQHWRKIMKSEVWEFEQNENDISPVLYLSYQLLLSDLKQCFAYCSLFPKGSCFRKDELVQLWMAQCFTESKNGMVLEDVGSGIIDDLSCRSLFQLDRVSGSLHDLIHDVTQFAFRGDCFRMDDVISKGYSEKTRHILLVSNDLQPSKLRDLCKCEKLRTLLFHRRLFLHFISDLELEWNGQTGGWIAYRS